jgi:hypothetical protein
MGIEIGVDNAFDLEKVRMQDVLELLDSHIGKYERFFQETQQGFWGWVLSDARDARDTALEVFAETGKVPTITQIQKKLARNNVYLEELERLARQEMALQQGDTALDEKIQQTGKDLKAVIAPKTNLN